MHQRQPRSALLHLMYARSPLAVKSSASRAFLVPAGDPAVLYAGETLVEAGRALSTLPNRQSRGNRIR
jgi:hypothetical protein